MSVVRDTTADELVEDFEEVEVLVLFAAGDANTAALHERAASKIVQYIVKCFEGSVSLEEGMKERWMRIQSFQSRTEEALAIYNDDYQLHPRGKHHTII